MGVDEARALALRVLAFRARTEAQLRARLLRAGHGREADEVLAWLRRLGYLDDRAYAEARARELLRAGRLGPARAVQKLRAEGVESGLARASVDLALEAALSPAVEASGAEPPAGEAAERPPSVAGGREASERALCREALAKKLGGAEVAALSPRERARAARFLLGRGFSAAVVSRALGGWGEEE